MLAKITFGVQVDKAVSAEIALNTLNTNIAKVMKALTDLGIEQKISAPKTILYIHSMIILRVCLNHLAIVPANK